MAKKESVMERSTNSDEQALRGVHATWIDAVNAGDLARLLTLQTDDAVFLSPGEQPFGREEFSAAFPAAHRRYRIRCVSELEEVSVAGEMAYVRSRDTLDLMPIARGEAEHLAGHRMTIYRKQPDGRWLLARDIHNLTKVEASTS